MQANFKPLTTNTVDILLPMMQQFYAIDNYPINAVKSAELCRQFISSENLGRAWIIEADGKTAGYVILTFVFSFEYGGRIAFVDELFILPQMQGKGLGRQAIAFIKQQTRPLDIKLLYLEVENHNKIAQKLYLSQGFEMHNRGIMKYKP